MTATGCYGGLPHDRIVSTTKLLAHFRAFLRSDCHEMRDPVSGWGFYLDKAAARRKLSHLIDVAINRKAGIPDVPVGRKFDPDYVTRVWRDCYRVRDMAKRIRHYSLETPELTRRFGHLLSRYDD